MFAELTPGEPMPRFTLDIEKYGKQPNVNALLNDDRYRDPVGKYSMEYRTGLDQPDIKSKVLYDALGGDIRDSKTLEALNQMPLADQHRWGVAY
jgi:hypothetical protein